jgi:hypothetical protein
MSNRLAVVVGIDRYAGYIRIGGRLIALDQHRLYGCVNDANSVRALLIGRFAFKPEDIALLTDAQAVRASIIDRLTGMARRAKAGDHLLFYFSGHGSIYSPPGDAAKKTARGSFEVLCPHDTDWDREIFISDQDLRSVMSLLPEKAALEIVLDACCSGGMADIASAHAASHRLYESDAGIPPSASRGRRFLPPPRDVLQRIAEQPDAARTGTMSALVEAAGPRRCILWAAARHDQTSEEYIPDQGREHGAFTYFFDAFMNAEPAAPRRAVLDQVRNGLKRARFTQLPQLFPDATDVNDTGFLQPGGIQR